MPKCRQSLLARPLSTMHVLFDHGTPSGIAQSLAEHEVTLAIDRGWDKVSNGELLAKADAAGFEILLTTDKNIRYQQNLKGRKKCDRGARKPGMAHRKVACRPNHCRCE